MKNVLRNSRHLYAGILFSLLGLATIILAQKYQMGTATNMGPGYFPTLLGVVVLGLGLTAIVQSVLSPRNDPIEDLELVPLVLLTGSIVAFGLSIERIGLVGATFALVLICSYQRLLKRPVEVLVIAVVLSLLCVGIFVYGVDLGMTVFGPQG